MGKQKRDSHPDAVPVSFDDLQLADFGVLKAAQREKCPKCGKRKMHYCYFCYEPLVQGMPHPELPIPCHVIKHPGELQSKSTAVHAKVLAPEKVNIHDFPNVPDIDPATAVLLFPSADAKSLEELDPSTVQSVVFIDSTWNQTGRILAHPFVQSLRKVKITSRQTRFWRYQSVGDTCLSTIEAIYYFYRDFIERVQGTYAGQVDNLLYLYSYQYHLIQDTYRQTEKNFRHIPGWVEGSDAKREKLSGDDGADERPTTATNTTATAPAAATAESAADA